MIQKGKLFHVLDIMDYSLVITILRVVVCVWGGVDINGKENTNQRDSCCCAHFPADLTQSSLHSSPKSVVAQWPKKHQEEEGNQTTKAQTGNSKGALQKQH